MRRRGAQLTFVPEHRTAPSRDHIPLQLTQAGSTPALSVASDSSAPQPSSQPTPLQRVLGKTQPHLDRSRFGDLGRYRFCFRVMTTRLRVRAEVCRSVGRAFRKSIKSEPNKVRASRRDYRYTGGSIAIPKEKLRNSRDGAQSRNKAVSPL